jgi:hypothetical protein
MGDIICLILIFSFERKSRTEMVKTTLGADCIAETDKWTARSFAPDGLLAQPGNSRKVRSPSFALAAGLKRRILGRRSKG